MKRLLALAVPTVLLAIAGCGGDTCTSNPAAIAAAPGQTCTLAPGSTATISVQLCAKCSDSFPSCQAEFLPEGNPDRLEVAPVVQQCQAQQGCAVQGCNISVPTATCQVAVPAGLSGTLPLQIIGETTVGGTVAFGSGTSCTL